MRLIDADVLDELIVESFHMTEQEYVRAGYSIVRILMDKCPTVDAEPARHGHWIERTKVYPDLLNDSTYNYECSECGHWDTHGADVEVPYCWHCGAKMTGENNGF